MLRGADGDARAALRLWRGPALADVADEPFAATEIRRLDELRMRALEAAIEAALRDGHPVEALTLVDELGVEPSPELRKLHAAILRQDPSLEPRPTARALPSGTVSMLFTDIEGSTRLLNEHGTGFAAMLGEHRRLVRAAVQRHGGVEVGTDGDAFFFAFTAARNAAAAARDAQAALDGGPVRVRMGITRASRRSTTMTTWASTCTEPPASAPSHTEGRWCCRNARGRCSVTCSNARRSGCTGSRTCASARSSSSSGSRPSLLCGRSMRRISRRRRRGSSGAGPSSARCSSCWSSTGS